MKIVMFGLAAVFALVWVVSMGTSTPWSPLQAILSFLGVGIMLGLGGILAKLEQLSKPPAPPEP